MMGTEIFKIDASWAEKWTKMRVSFLSAPTVGIICSGITPARGNHEHRPLSGAVGKLMAVRNKNGSGVSRIRNLLHVLH